MLYIARLYSKKSSNISELILDRVLIGDIDDVKNLGKDVT
jgi:hypothetical protein